VKTDANTRGRHELVVRLYEPQVDAAELEVLAEEVTRRGDKVKVVLQIMTGLAALLVIINLGTTAFNPLLNTPERLWSVIAVLSLGLVMAFPVIRDLWLRPRALEAQRSFIAQRDLHSHALAVQAAERRLGEVLESLSPRRRELEEVLAAGKRASGRLLEPTDGRRSVISGLALRGARLDTYRVALGSLEIDALLQPEFLRSAAAAKALEAAVGQLAASEETVTQEAAGRVAPPPPRHSIAVLPFADLTRENDQEFFAAGLGDELINALAKIEGLRVIARSSALTFRGQDWDVREVGRKLKVETVLEGSVRKSGDVLRITVQLIRASDAVHLWSERYDRSAKDVFAVQDEITSAVIGQLEGELLGKVAHVPIRPQTEDIAAYHLYLKGRYFWNKRTPTDLQESVGYFEQAIARDGGYALAHAGLADSLDLLGYYSVLAPREVFPRAEKAALAALDLDESLAEAHCSLAFAKLLYDWDWRRAGEGFARTFELNPGYATAHHWFAEYLAFLGRHDQAIAQARTALALDPLSLIINVLLGWSLYYARRYDEAIEQLEQTLQLDATFAPAEYWLGLSYEQKGDIDRALAAFDRAISGSERSPMVLAARGRLCAERSEEGKAAQVIEELLRKAETAYVPAYHIAAIHSGRGDTSRTLEWLVRAGRERDTWMVFLNIDPIWDRYRNEPRFKALVAEVGLGPGAGEAS
jgi:TolB-like protein/Tfp pilus assembly protein PilF